MHIFLLSSSLSVLVKKVWHVFLSPEGFWLLTDFWWKHIFLLKHIVDYGFLFWQPFKYTLIIFVAHLSRYPVWNWVDTRLTFEIFFLLSWNLLAKLLYFFPFCTCKFLLILKELLERPALLRDLSWLFGRQSGLKSAFLGLFGFSRLLTNSVTQMCLLDIFVILEP